MTEYKPFFQYVIYNPDGFIDGIADDAPAQMKEEFNKWFAEYQKNIKNGVYE